MEDACRLAAVAAERRRSGTCVSVDWIVRVHYTIVESSGHLHPTYIIHSASCVKSSVAGRWLGSVSRGCGVVTVVSLEKLIVVIYCTLELK